MEKLKAKMKSLRFSMILYVGFGLVLGAGLTLLLQYWTEQSMLSLMNPRPDTLVFVGGTDISINLYEDSTIPDNKTIPDVSDPSLFRLLKFIHRLSPFVLFSLSILLSIFLFYRRVMFRPLRTLGAGIDKISRRELDFSLKSSSENELGKLIQAFESMREELAAAFDSLWRSEEKQRSLYRAFAHDLRTPLTVIKGSHDNIRQVAAPNNDWVLALHSLSLSTGAVGRIEAYAKQLKEIESTNDWVPELKDIDITWLAGIVKQQADILSSESGKVIEVTSPPAGTVCIDSGMLLRVADNLIQNALHYAEHSIFITLTLSERIKPSPDAAKEYLMLSVCDDGPGFSPEALKKAAEPFYTTGQAEGHMGIGLTVSGILVQKCGGHMDIINTNTGGACVRLFV